MRTALIATLALVAGCGDPSTPPPDPIDCTSPGQVCTWAGTGIPAFNGDGLALTATTFYWPMDMEFALNGRPYILDWQNHRVRRVEDGGRVVTVIGSDLPGDGPPDGGDLRPEGAPGTTVELNHPTDLQALSDGTLLLAAWHNHKIRRFDPATGRVTVVCGLGPGDNALHVPASRALLNQPKSVAADADGNIYIADSRNQRIRVIDRDNIVDTVAGIGKSGFAGDDGPPSAAMFAMQEINENPEPGGSLTVDDQHHIYLADTFNNRIRRIDLVAGMVTTVAGNGERGFGGDGGPATQASLDRPRDVELGPDGRLYVADTDNHRVRAIDLTTGVITTVAGSGTRGFAGDGGPATDATFNRPFGIAFDRDGNLYVSDTFNNRIRKVVRR
jgi:DNA-binding beta-propeller fold protein YncE